MWERADEEDMNIIKPGTKARTVIGNIEGIITAVKITPDGVCYEFSYFDNGNEYKGIQLYECEFTVTDNEKTTIGWKK